MKIELAARAYYVCILVRYICNTTSIREVAFTGAPEMTPCSPRRAQRQNVPFAKEQEMWIVLEYDALINVLAVRRERFWELLLIDSGLPTFLAPL